MNYEKMNIKYPVLIIAKNHIGFIENDENLEKCNKRALRNGYYNGLILIDSNSKRYLIKNAIKESTEGILWGFNLLRGQQLKVSLVFEKKIENVELSEFQELLTKQLNKYRDFWDSDGNFEERIEYIKNTKSIKEIIEKLTFEYYKEY
tara:strand:+ start:149 stop:592 length:444 start_codon:yes stop_codon:yes gene_type:complete